MSQPPERAETTIPPLSEEERLLVVELRRKNWAIRSLGRTRNQAKLDQLTAERRVLIYQALEMLDQGELTKIRVEPTTNTNPSASRFELVVESLRPDYDVADRIPLRIDQLVRFNPEIGDVLERLTQGFDSAEENNT